MSRRGRNLLLMSGPHDLFRDDFGGPQLDLSKWTLVDTEGKISVSGGSLVFAGGKVAPDEFDPLAEKTVGFVRVAGLVFETKIITGGLSGGGPKLHLATAVPNTTKAQRECGVYPSTTAWAYGRQNAAGIPLPISTPVGTTVWVRIQCLATGVYVSMSLDSVTFYRLWNEAAGTASPLYPLFQVYSQAGSVNWIAVPQVRPVPSPLVSATPAATSPSLGAELNSGTLAVNSWYSITATQANYFYTGSAIGDTFQATAATALDANNKVQLIDLGSIHSLAGDAGRRAGLFEAAVTIGARTQGGLGILVDSLVTPTYELKLYVDRITGKVVLVKREASTDTVLISTATAVTYAAAAKPRIVVVPVASSANSSVAVYYGATQVQIGTTQTISLGSYGTLNAFIAPLAATTPGLQEAHA